jgi:hypothetical protein
VADTDISILDRCTGRQLKELLALASTSAKVKPHWLVEVGDLEQLQGLLTEMCSGTEQSGAALLDPVCSPDTTVEVLIAVKEIAKGLAAAAETEPQRAAATLFYHLTVASALANHGRIISSTDPAGRLALYQELAAELTDEECASIFGKAIAALPTARS